MLKKIVFALACMAGAAYAQTTTPTANSWESRFRNEANNGVYIYYIVPDGAGDQIATYNGSTNKPEYSKLGTGLSRSGNTMNVALSSSQLTDTTATGQALMTATDAAAGRAAIGAGTVSSVTAGTGLSGGVITGTGTISLPNTGTAGTYSGLTTDAQGRVTGGTNRSAAYTARSLNTCFQVSSTRDAMVSYAVDIQTSLSLTSGQQGTVYLRLYTNNTCTTGTQEVTRFVNGQTGTLTIGLALTQNVTATLTGLIPAGAWLQVVTENNTGTPTFQMRSSQEILM